MKQILKALDLIAREEESDSTWKIEYNKFRPAQEGLRESLCTLGNGYMCSRGALNEVPATIINYPATYIAGIYNKTPTTIAGKTIYNDDLVNLPNWLILSFRVENTGEWISPLSCEILFYKQELDMKKGYLIRKMRLKDRKGHIFFIEAQRIVHIDNPHLAAIRYSITSENYSGPVIMRSAIDGRVRNSNVARYKQLNTLHLKEDNSESLGKNGIALSVKTSQSKHKISMASRIRIFCGRKELPRKFNYSIKKKVAIQETTFDLKKSKTVDIEKVVSVFTSRDTGVKNPSTAAKKLLQQGLRFETLLNSHRKTWEGLWKTFDIKIEGDLFSQKVLRLHAFHLLQTANLHNRKIDAGLPARGLHGEAYRGHIFWDEVFVLPYYDYHLPDISQALIQYRFKRLDQARRYAAENGFKGAMFPWQSSASGEEETQEIHLNPLSGKWGPDNSRIQRHVSFAVVLNTWQHFKRSGDKNFLQRYGAEIILSVALFASSMTKLSRKDGRFHTDGVMGPDEFHEKLPGATKAGFKDNAYTNIMIVWTLHKALETLDILAPAHKKRLIDTLEITANEIKRWKNITQKMNLIINKENIISQFDGYFKLKEINLASYRKKYGNIQRMDRILKAEGKSPNNFKVAKQADVLMAFYLLDPQELEAIFHQLGYNFNTEMIRKNYEYYIKRTSHGSTLSKVVHCYVAHLFGATDNTWSWYQEVLKSDIYDIQGGTTPEGIHTGVMGGSMDIFRRVFAGVRILDKKITINPTLPSQWQRVQFKLQYRGAWISLNITKEEISIFIHKEKQMIYDVPIEVYGKLYHFEIGKTQRIFITPKQLKKNTLILEKRILIINSNLSFSERLRTRLESEGYLVQTARNKTEALDILEHLWTDLIIIPLNMAGLKGLGGPSFQKYLRTIKHYANIPVIAEDDSLIPNSKGFIKEHISAFYKEPINMKNIIKSVNKVLEENMEV